MRVTFRVTPAKISVCYFCQISDAFDYLSQINMLCQFLTFGDSDPLIFRAENWNISYSCPVEGSHQLWFSTTFCFRVRSMYGTNRWTSR